VVAGIAMDAGDQGGNRRRAETAAAYFLAAGKAVGRHQIRLTVQHVIIDR